MSSVYLHHALLHFPVALIALAGLLFLLGLAKRLKGLNEPAYTLLQLGVLFGILAAIPGLLSAGHIIEDGVDSAVVAGHRNAALLAVLVAGISLLILFLVRKERMAARFNWVGKLLAVFAALLILLAADRGGRMIHPSIRPFATEHEHEEIGSGHSHSGGETVGHHGEMGEAHHAGDDDHDASHTDHHDQSQAGDQHDHDHD